MLNKNCCTQCRKPLKVRMTGIATLCAAVRPDLQTRVSRRPVAEKVSPMYVPKVLPMSVPNAERGAFEMSPFVTGGLYNRALGMLFIWRRARWLPFLPEGEPRLRRD